MEKSVASCILFGALILFTWWSHRKALSFPISTSYHSSKDRTTSMYYVCRLELEILSLLKAYRKCIMKCNFNWVQKKVCNLIPPCLLYHVKASYLAFPGFYLLFRRKKYFHMVLLELLYFVLLWYFLEQLPFRLIHKFIILFQFPYLPFLCCFSIFFWQVQLY